MKRTWEYALSIIGVIIAAIFLIVTIIAAVYLNSIDLKEMMDYSLMTDSEFSSSEVDMSVKFSWAYYGLGSYLCSLPWQAV
ncbi:hypothetical protein KEH51_03500 [[Brevibacterium] frigoritolerans]|uniref:Uncharacterized protein n=1 Tax=Peribacillus frigoritolerans TaxID=450367 RepID=A0A941FPI9_9BACI|nr:hypothetical protein [Peribacillus frigoritolerans]